MGRRLGVVPRVTGFRLFRIAAAAVAVGACGAAPSGVHADKPDASTGVIWQNSDESRDYGRCVDRALKGSGQWEERGVTPTIRLTDLQEAVEGTVVRVGPVEWNSATGAQWWRSREAAERLTEAEPRCFRRVQFRLEGLFTPGAAKVGAVGDVVEVVWFGDGDPNHGWEGKSDVRYGGRAGPVSVDDHMLVAVEVDGLGLQGMVVQPALLVQESHLVWKVRDGRVRLHDGPPADAEEIRAALRDRVNIPAAPHGLAAFAAG
jgi:hypothetical protein